jgi:hypothetical protein
MGMFVLILKGGGWKKFVKTNMTISPKPVKAGLPNLKKPDLSPESAVFLLEEQQQLAMVCCCSTSYNFFFCI